MWTTNVEKSRHRNAPEFIMRQPRASHNCVGWIVWPKGRNLDSNLRISKIRKINKKTDHNCRPWSHQSVLKSKARELRFGRGKTLIQMMVLTKGRRDPMVKFKIMVERRVASVQIILVMSWVGLPPVGEEYCCIPKFLLNRIYSCLGQLWRR